MKKIIYRNRLIKAVIVCTILFLIDMLACYVSLLEMYRRGFMSQSAFSENVLTGDFHSVLNYGVVYLFIYLFFINYIMGKPWMLVMIRNKDRERYWKSQFVYVIVATSIFVILHEFESFVFLVLFGNINVLIKHYWIQGILVQTLISLLYYIQSYMLLEILVTKVNKNLSILITIIIASIQFCLLNYYINRIWLPIRDIDLLGKLCSGQYSFIQCFFAIIKMCALNFILYIFFVSKKNKEDLLHYEKG